MLTLHTLPGSGNKQRRRVGRGNARKGTYSGRGMKGQRARSGGRKGLKLRGLKQTFLHVPKQHGFRSLAPKTQAVNLAALEKAFDAGATVNAESLLKARCISTVSRPVKILGTGTLSKKLTVQVNGVSATARIAIEKAGGAVTVTSFKTKKEIKIKPKKS
jgi:large subunit ribosomal protein L15